MGQTWEGMVARRTAGLLFPSETDAPLHPFVWEGDEPFSPDALLRARGLPAETPVEVREVERLFRPAVTLYEGDGPEKAASARRFRRLLRFLQARLHDLRVYAVGQIAIDIYLVGEGADGRTVGLTTQVVET